MRWYESFDQKIEEYLPDLTVEKDVPMARYTSFRIGGPVRRMAFPATPEQMVLLMSIAQECEPLLLGNGTNLLVADEGLDRLVIHTRDMAELKCGSNANEIIAQAGVPLVKLANFACAQGLTGLEFAHGIPGSVGGAICMNAGAYGGEMKQVVASVAVLFPEEGVKYLSCEEMDFSYRHSLLSEHADAVVLYAVFRLLPGDSNESREKMEELMKKRKASQPLEWPSAGSTFKRPTGYFAGTLIEQTGLKGLTVGGAQVSEKHAGFVINRGGATFADVTELIAQVQDKVYAAHGVMLEPEVRIIR